MTEQATKVRHKATGNAGTITDRSARYGVRLGPWSHVAFDDGLRCWVLDENLEPIATALPDWYHQSQFDSLSLQLKWDAKQREALVAWIADIDARAITLQGNLDFHADILRERDIQP